MDFNSSRFLFVFVPIFFSIFFIAKPSMRKWIVLIASVILYTWFQKLNSVVVFGLIGLNYCALLIFRRKFQTNSSPKVIYIFSIVINLIVLIFFKLFATENWLHATIVTKLPELILLQKITYPVGLSFIVFQLISVLIEGYRSHENAPENFWDYANYLLMFPKISMGPITRFSEISPQLSKLNVTSENVLAGSKRFIIGLAKKVIIADQLAIIVNAGFGLEKPAFSTSIAWLLIISFLVQIYYDFSGYIDMGIGLAMIIGIKFPENFNSPYSSLSMSDFWRRWHMTLTSWFRDYLFYPLEFRRRKTKTLRQESNTLIVFALTGLWHGLTLNYLIWGILQGLIISFENSRFGSWLKRIPTIFQRIYFMFMILISWVIFRSESVGYALRFFKRLIIVDQNVQLYPFSVSQPIPIINNSVLFVLLIGIIGLFPIKSYWASITARLKIENSIINFFLKFAVNIGYIVLLIISIALFTSQNFIPSIYGRF